MTIETLLTLLVAAAILVVAAALRLTVLTVVRVAFKLAGRPFPAAPVGVDAASSLPRKVRLGSAARASGTLAMYVSAIVWTALLRAYRPLRRWAGIAGGWTRARGAQAWSWSRPRVQRGASVAAACVASATAATREWWSATAAPSLRQDAVALRDVLTPDAEKLGDLHAFERTSPFLPDVDREEWRKSA